MIEVNISKKDMLLIEEAVKKAGSNEVGGFGTIKYTKENNIPYVDSLYLPKQTVSSGEVDWGIDGVLDYINYLNTLGDTREQRGLFSWHSHGNMDTFWSATDEGFISLAGTEGVPYIFSLVTNNKGESLVRLDVFPKNTCQIIGSKNIHVSYDENEVELSVFCSEKLNKKIAALDGVKNYLADDLKLLREKHKKEISELELDYAEEISEAEKGIENHEKSLRGDARKEIEDVWDERVSTRSPIIYKKYKEGSGSNASELQYNWYDYYNWGDDYNWSDDTINSTATENTLFEELGDSLKLFDYDYDNGNFRYVGNNNLKKKIITLEESSENFVEVFSVFSQKSEIVKLQDYLFSNADLDPQWGDFLLITEDFDPKDVSFWAANEASLS